MQNGEDRNMKHMGGFTMMEHNENNKIKLQQNKKPNKRSKDNMETLKPQKVKEESKAAAFLNRCFRLMSNRCVVKYVFINAFMLFCLFIVVSYFSHTSKACELS